MITASTEYGNVNFIKVDIDSGHSTYKVFWRREGAEKGTRIAWLKEGLKPSAKLALFFCKNACSLEDGHHEHYYYGKGLEPPKRINHEIHPFSTRRAAHTALCSAAAKRAVTS
jgi:hypothetical protein